MDAWDFIFLECHADFRMTFRGNFLPLHKIQLCFHIDRHQSIRDGHNACEYIVINAMFCITGALRCYKMFYVTENILAVDAGFKVSRAFLVEICGSSSFPFPLLHQENNSICLQTSLVFQKQRISFQKIITIIPSL